MNCGPPLLPSNGYIVLSNDTIEGSSISFICLTPHSETVTLFITVCNQTGVWEPHPIDICQLGMFIMITIRDTYSILYIIIYSEQKQPYT